MVNFNKKTLSLPLSLFVEITKSQHSKCSSYFFTIPNPYFYFVKCVFVKKLKPCKSSELKYSA